ncbi:methyltransferase [Cohnella mopanensis]|uniref:methyltransferase n=1 Tax=Cohnella mopanensis TaxID=2911966 RepID=UPI001EF99897|nr:methyltransferase [Cohnella mopanensis]
MDKIIVEIYLPSINQKYDVFIPITLRLHEIEALLIGAFIELSDGYFVASQNAIMCDMQTGTLLDINKSAIELGLYNGSRLMLI